MKRTEIKSLVLTGLFAALCFVGATIQIVIPIGIGEPKLHLGNLFMLVGALVLGGVKGGLSSAIGMGLSDVFSGMYAVYAPGTIIGKFCAGFVCGKIAQKGDQTVKRYTFACIIGAIVNVLLSTANTIFVKAVINSGEIKPVAVAALGNIGVGIINAVIAVVLAVPITLLLNKVLGKVK